MALKSIAGNRFSLITFAAAQVAMDIEPGVGMLRGSSTLHGWTHTYVGATVIATLVLLCRPLWGRLLTWWNAELRRHTLDWLTSPEPIGWLPVAIGAYAGTYSHVFLDSIMHLDMEPFAPLSSANALLGLISVSALYLACFGAGVFGLMLWLSSVVRQHYDHRR